METINHEGIEFIPEKFNSVLEVSNDRPGWLLRYGLLVILAGLVVFGLAVYPFFKRSAEYAANAVVRPARQAGLYEGSLSVPLEIARRLHPNDRLRIDTRSFTGNEHYSDGRVMAVGALIGPDGRITVTFAFDMPASVDPRFHFDQATFKVYVVM